MIATGALSQYFYVSVTAATSASFNIDSLQFMLRMIHSLLTTGYVNLAGFKLDCGI